MFFFVIHLCFLKAAEGWVHFFFIHPVCPCRFIGKLRPFKLKDINDQCLLISVTLLLMVVVLVVVWMVCCWWWWGVCVSVCVPFVGFVDLRLLISCVFIAVVNLFGLEFSSITFCKTGFEIRRYCLNMDFYEYLVFFINGG